MEKYEQSIYDITNYILQKHPEVLACFVEQYRHSISKSLADFHRNTVAYGPFKGLRFVSDSHWGSRDRGAMILGLYEQEVLRQLVEVSGRYTTFVDLGAADGYYGIGVLVNRMFEKSYCFEVVDQGREIIAKNAAINNVSERVVIYGEARTDFYKAIPQNEIDNSVVLIDVEGYEFELLDEVVLEQFKKSVMIIELHDWVDGADSKLQKLMQSAEKTHHVSTFSVGGRDLSGYNELKSLNDSSRWLLCSEGRQCLMSWLRLDPL